jgi:hypothetical protein
MGILIVIVPVLLCLFSGALNPDAKFIISKNRHINIGIKNKRIWIMILLVVVLCIFINALAAILKNIYRQSILPANLD